MKKFEKELREAVELWGLDSQIGMLHEEMGELMQAINKWRRDAKNIDNFVEELVDVKICLFQLELALFGEEKVAAVMEKKIEKLRGKLESTKIERINRSLKTDSDALKNINADLDYQNLGQLEISNKLSEK